MRLWSTGRDVPRVYSKSEGNWSKDFRGAKITYPRLKKLALVLIEASRRMKPYFQAHTIVVYTDMPLRQALQNLEKSGRLM